MSATPRPAGSWRMGWIALIAICLSPLIVWSITVPDPLRYLRLEGLPPGQPLYVAAKLAGLFALFLFWAQCMLALARRIPLLPAPSGSEQRLHMRLGLATLSLIVLHVGLFVAAASLRTGEFAWDLLMPDFSHGYYRNSIALGAVALWLSLLAGFAGRRLMGGRRRWKPLHMLWPAVFALAFVHAINIGTESRYGAMRYIVFALAATLLATGLLRLIRKRRSLPRRSQGIAPETTV